MTVAAIIAEYNPFHNGHAYLAGEIRRAFPDAAIAAVMSGNLVQRGEFALLEKHARAAAAVLSGIDVVFELAPVWSMQPANIFARAAVSIVERLGCVDYLCFGSECGDAEILADAAQKMGDPVFKTRIDELIGRDPSLSYPAAAELAYREQGGGDILGGSNNILALEYLRALYSDGSAIIPFTVKRVGANFNSGEVTGRLASATHIRELVRSGRTSGLHALMPPASYEKLMEYIRDGRIAHTESLSAAVLTHIRRLDTAYMQKIAGINGGIEQRIKKAAERSATLAELVHSLSLKHFTSRTAGRLILNLFFGITGEESRMPPPFTNLLAANGRGRELLAGIRKSTSITVVTKKADYLNGCADTESRALYEKCLFIDGAYALSPENKKNGRSAVAVSPVMV